MKEIIRTLKPYIPEEPAEAVKERLGVERLVRLSANEIHTAHRHWYGRLFLAM